MMTLSPCSPQALVVGIMAGHHGQSAWDCSVSAHVKRSQRSQHSLRSCWCMEGVTVIQGSGNKANLSADSCHD